MVPSNVAPSDKRSLRTFALWIASTSETHLSVRLSRSDRQPQDCLTLLEGVELGGFGVPNELPDVHGYVYGPASHGCSDL
jgi:hypothetical protein